MIAINGIIITDNMKQAGDEISNQLFDASIKRSFNGLGGCGQLDMNEYPEQNRPLIQKYLDGELDSIEIFYIVMERQKSIDNNTK